MTKTSVYYEMAVIVLMGSMAVAALADDRGVYVYGGFGSVLSADSEKSAAQQTTYGGFGSVLSADSEKSDVQQTTHGGFGSVLSVDPEMGIAQQDKLEIREPMETGAVPVRSVDSSGLHSNPIGDEPTVEFGGQSFRPGLDTGP